MTKCLFRFTARLGDAIARKSRYLSASCAIALAGLVGAPSSSIVDAIPTVGGKAHAYAPCSAEYTAMQVAWNFHNEYGGAKALKAAWQATYDWIACMSG